MIKADSKVGNLRKSPPEQSGLNGSSVLARWSELHRFPGGEEGAADAPVSAIPTQRPAQQTRALGLSQPHCAQSEMPSGQCLGISPSRTGTAHPHPGLAQRRQQIPVVLLRYSQRPLSAGFRPAASTSSIRSSSVPRVLVFRALSCFHLATRSLSHSQDAPA